MRRPVVFLFLLFAFGIALEYHLMLGKFHFLVFAAVLSTAYIFSRIFHFCPKQVLTRRVCLYLLVVMLGSVFFNLAENRVDPLETAEGETCTVEGRIVSVQIKDDTSFQMLITAQNTQKRLVRVKGAMEDSAEYIGKWASIRGTVTIPSERRNPGLFDYRLYLKTKGVRVILQSDSAHITSSQENSSFLSSMLAQLKYGFLNRLEEAMEPEAYGLMVGMLFGDCSFISDDTYEVFQKNGVAHILSVSGIHVGIVYLYISRLLGNRKTRTFYLLAAFMLLFYAALSEFSASVVRSVVMIMIHMFSKASYRRYDFITCTSASALGMLVFNPFYLFNAGFQLSYMAVFCLASMLPWMNRMIGIMEEKGKSELLTGTFRYLSPLLIIQLGMAPLTAYLFNYFSVASFFVNVPIIAISGIIIPLGIFLIPVSFLGGLFFGVGAQAAELLIDIMIWLNDLFFLPGIGFFNMVSPTAYLLLIFYGFFFLLSSEFFRILYQRRRKKSIAVYCSLILILSLLMPMVAGISSCEAELVFVDVGQGDCLHIRTPDGRNILIDGGGSQSYNVGEKILLPYLLKNGVKTIDLAIVTHLHDDHYLGIRQLAEQMQIKNLGIYEANRLREAEILEETGLHGQDILYLTKGDRIQIEKDVWLDILYPKEHSAEDYEKLILEEEDENWSSLIVKIYYRGLSVMMTGDLGLEGEQEIMRDYEENPVVLAADILKIGHHGSKYSTDDDFLDTVHPKIAVFQVGKNNFGHPHPSVIDKCAKKGIIVYRNDLNGAIIFTYGENLWNVGSMILKLEEDNYGI